jgi:hypothetical protein
MKLESGEVLVLRTCNADMTSFGDFVWPRRGKVVAPDFNATKQCGNGLHGLLKGIGQGSLLNWDKDAVWLAVKVEESKIIDLDGKVKFPEGEVVCCGNKEKVVAFISKHHPEATGDMVGGSAQAGDEGSAQAGYRGSAQAGYGGSAQAGDGGIIMIKYWDGEGKRYRLKIGYIGEGGLKPNTPYILDGGCDFREAF